MLLAPHFLLPLPTPPRLPPPPLCLRLCLICFLPPLCLLCLLPPLCLLPGLCLWGFGVATAIGGLSSAYSFSSTAIPPGTPDVTAGAIAGQWFYAMAGE